jgi:hypothetical protein
MGTVTQGLLGSVLASYWNFLWSTAATIDVIWYHIYINVISEIALFFYSDPCYEHSWMRDFPELSFTGVIVITVRSEIQKVISNKKLQPNALKGLVVTCCCCWCHLSFVVVVVTCCCHLLSLVVVVTCCCCHLLLLLLLLSLVVVVVVVGSPKVEVKIFFQYLGATSTLQRPEPWHEASSILGPINIRRYRNKFSCHDDLTPGICALLS